MTKLSIIHGGQTGVDRGAHHGALEAGIGISGFMPRDERDELGLIPADVSKHLTQCRVHGYQKRTVHNVDLSHAVLVVVADKLQPYATPGTKVTLVATRLRGIPRLVVDPGDAPSMVHGWIRKQMKEWTEYSHNEAKPNAVFFLMVAGPRASKWPEGQEEAARFLRTWRGDA